MKNKTKTILFASLIAAMILPFSGMMMAEAAPNENANDRKNIRPQTEGQKLLESFLEMAIEKQEMTRVLQDMKDGVGVVNDVDRLSAEISALDKNLKKTEADLEAFEKALRAKITISPELRSQLEEAQSALDDSGLPLTLYGVDPKRELLMVQILDSAKNTGVEERVLEIVGKDTPIEFDYGPGIVLTGCSSDTSDCDPIIGGIKIQSDTYSPGHTLSFPVQQQVGNNWIDGFLTTGHTVTANGEDVWQPVENEWWQTSTKIGDVNSGDRVFGGSCDCAFITKSTSTTDQDGVYAWANSYYVISSKDDANNQETVYMRGITSGLKSGTVEYVNITIPAGPNNPSISGTDLIEGFVSAQGDSGAPIFSNGEYHGIQMGHVEYNNVDHSIMIPWTSAESNLDLR